MPTIDDLKVSFNRLADTAPAADRVLAHVTAPIGRRRRAAPLVAAAAVVAIVVGALTLAQVVGSPGDRSGSAGGDAGGTKIPAMTWRFSFAPLRGYTVERFASQWNPPSAVDTTGDFLQGAQITPVHGRARGTYTYEPGSIRFPGNAGMASTDKTEVRVNGNFGYFLPGISVDLSQLPARFARLPWQAVEQASDLATLVWRNGDGSWSMLSGTFGFRPATMTYDNGAAKRQLLHIAGAVQLGRDDAITMPFHVTVPGANFAAAGSDIRMVHGPLPICLDYLPLGVPAVDTDDSLDALEICRMSSVAAAKHSGDSHYERTMTRAIGDGTSLVIVLAKKYANLMSARQQRHMLNTANVTPDPSKRGTWIPIN